jgi:hypothetical protein
MFDAILEVGADSRTGWTVRIVADRPLSELDPKRVKVRGVDGFRIVERNDDGFRFNNGLSGRDRTEAWCSWADVVARFRKAKVSYELTNCALEDGFAANCDLSDVQNS